MDSVVEAITKRAMAIFTTRGISLTKCGDLYATVVDGRLYVWNSEVNGFNLLLPLPLANYSVDLITVPDVIQNRRGLIQAIATADIIARGKSVWPAPAASGGFRAEDDFLRACLQLGFTQAEYSRPSEPFTVRRGTDREDRQRKIDFVLTFPGSEHRGPPVEVPLQITIRHSEVSHKARLAREGKIAYLPFNRFIGSSKGSVEFLENAAEGDPYWVWLCGELIKIAVGRYLNGPVRLPNDQTIIEAFFKNKRTQRVLEPRLKAELKEQIQAILDDSGEYSYRVDRAKEVLAQYETTYGTPYETDLAQIDITGW